VGDSLFTDWFPSWVLELAKKYSAIVVCGNHRLLPESTGVQILEDMDDFWKWLHSPDLATLLSSLSSPIQLDLDRVITSGESAGGLLSVYLALTYPDEIRAATAGYPMFNQEGLIDSGPPTGDLLVETPPESVITEHVKNIKPGDVVSSSVEPSRFALAFAIMGHNQYHFYERDADASPLHRDRLFQLRRLEHPETRLPRGGLVILHGRQDSVVPVNLSERFVRVTTEKLRGRQGADKIVLCIQDGEHGFDNPASLKEEWLKNALEGAVETWLE
jgi:acetyl esterase/lipase